MSQHSLRLIKTSKYFKFGFDFKHEYHAIYDDTSIISTFKAIPREYIDCILLIKYN